ncbi:MAG: DinB family protein [Planctomycetes bacterium]|nr:DinB family protein [Planctomycetota bacterium]MCB9826332.1 DinB family protein [Planctomycetota bacterium]MCB9901128.1 DinB family protein [Planctomycetota bacterium]
MTTPLTVAGAVLADLDVELDATRAVLGCLRPALWDAPTYPDAWTIGQLARHLVEVVYWLETVVAADRFDVTSRPPPERDAVDGPAALIERFDVLAASVRAGASRLDDAAMAAPWSLVQGDVVLQTLPRHVALRRACISHMIHHRAQLSAWLRAQGDVVPEIYPG